MKTIKSNKSYDLEDFIEDELINKCKKKKKKKKKKHKSSKKSSNKDNKKKIKKNKKNKKDNFKYSKIDLKYFGLTDDEYEEVKKNYKEMDETKKEGFINRLIESINMKTNISIDLTDESVNSIMVGIGAIVTTIVAARKALK